MTMNATDSYCFQGEPGSSSTLGAGLLLDVTTSQGDIIILRMDLTVLR